MCRPAACPKCNKITWKGCGMHIDQVKASVPAGQWCDGRHAAASADAHDGDAKPTFFARLSSWMRGN